MRVAVVHHWFVTLGGGERVAAILAGMFPEADIFTLLVTPRGLPPSLAERHVTPSLLQSIPSAHRVHRHLLPLYPFAVEELDLSSYDLVLTSDSGPMKGVITRPGALQVCYCHSPMRYLWDGYHAYTAGMSRTTRFPFSLAAHYVRNWDFLAAQRVNSFVANSRYVAARIKHYYKRDSTVIHPPVEVNKGFICDPPAEPYYLAAGRLVNYKRTDLLIEACNRLSRTLRIIGSGPELRRLKKLAGPHIQFLGQASNEVLWQNYAECRALLFAADEDFGMVPVEAQSCGRPVIAYGRGGSLETVREETLDKNGNEVSGTGVFFPGQTVESVMKAILDFEEREATFKPLLIRHHALQFSTGAFVSAMSALLIGLNPEIGDILNHSIPALAKLEGLDLEAA